MEGQIERRNGTLRALIVSLAMHGVFFLCVLVFGVRAPVVMVKSVHPQRVAELAMAGGSHRIRLVLPTAETSAHVRWQADHIEFDLCCRRLRLLRT